MLLANVHKEKISWVNKFSVVLIQQCAFLSSAIISFWSWSKFCFIKNWWENLEISVYNFFILIWIEIFFVYKSSFFSFQANWNWESKSCFNYYIVIFFNFSKKISFFSSSFTYLFLVFCMFSNVWYNESWHVLMFFCLTHRNSQKRKSLIFFLCKNAANSILSDHSWIIMKL